MKYYKIGEKARENKCGSLRFAFIYNHWVCQGNCVSNL